MFDYNLDPSQIDYLTGRANRRGLYDFYSGLYPNTTIHAMYIDIDNFKRVNDIYGHNAGDQLLVQISDLILRETGNFTSRIGGDEYVVIFYGPFYSHEDLEKVAAKLLSAMGELDFRKDILSIISLSIGIVYDQSVNQSLEDILKKCDTAMYQAKTSGKNRYSIYQANDSEQQKIYKIEAKMEEALKNCEFIPFFQPRLNMVTMQIVSAEVSVKWIDPSDGILSPKVFLPVFEKNGFISKLDIYLIDMACRIKAGWKDESFAHLPLSITISRLQLFDETFPTRLSVICDKYGISHSEIEIQMSERVFIQDYKEMKRMVDSLIGKNFKVAINDFGSGFSALNMLQNIPVDTIRMDDDFVKDSISNDRGRHVLRNIISLCKDLKLNVVAGGISTDEMANFIITCGCSQGQGKYYSDSLIENDFINYVNKYYGEATESFRFKFDGSLLSDDGSKEAEVLGCGISFTEGIFEGTKAVSFPGGAVQTNVLSIPNEVLFNDSYTISLWIRPRKNIMWSSALYVKYETGFCSIVPMSPDSHSDFRIRDSREVSGWYDLVALQLREDTWYHYTVIYNARTEKAISFVNGEVAFIMENVPTNRFAKLILLGGDVFQPSFEGDICELVIYNEAKDFDFVARDHENYLQTPGFIGN